MTRRDDQKNIKCWDILSPSFYLKSTDLGWQKQFSCQWLICPHEVFVHLRNCMTAMSSNRTTLCEQNGRCLRFLRAHPCAVEKQVEKAVPYSTEQYLSWSQNTKAFNQKTPQTQRCFQFTGFKRIHFQFWSNQDVIGVFHFGYRNFPFSKKQTKIFPVSKMPVVSIVFFIQKKKAEVFNFLTISFIFGKAIFLMTIFFITKISTPPWRHL